MLKIETAVNEHIELNGIKITLFSVEDNKAIIGFEPLEKLTPFLKKKVLVFDGEEILTMVI